MLVAIHKLFSLSAKMLLTTLFDKPWLSVKALKTGVLVLLLTKQIPPRSVPIHNWWLGSLIIADTKLLEILPGLFSDI